MLNTVSNKGIQAMLNQLTTNDQDFLLLLIYPGMKSRSHQNIQPINKGQPKLKPHPQENVPRKPEGNKQNVNHAGNNLVQVHKRHPSGDRAEKTADTNLNVGKQPRGKSSGRIWKYENKQAFTEIKIENKCYQTEPIRQEQNRRPSKSLHSKQPNLPAPPLPPTIPQTNIKKPSPAPAQTPVNLPFKDIGESQKLRIRNMKVTVQNSDKIKQDGTIPIKLVLVGDGSVGKTCMLISYTTDNFPTQYVPTVFDNYVADIKYGNHMVKLWLWDTAGQQEYAQLRLISYQKADVFFICFSMIDQNSLNNALNKWLPQVHEQCPKAIKILVGTKSDLHSQYILDPKNMHKAIPIEYINRKCEIKKCFFMPCSGLDQKGLNQVFNKAMGMVIDRVEKRKKEQSSLCQVI